MQMIRLIKRDGWVAYGFHNPDGSWVEIPEQGDQRITAPLSSPAQAQLSTAGTVREFLRQIGRRGGQARAARHSREEIAHWGRTRKKRNPALISEWRMLPDLWGMLIFEF